MTQEFWKNAETVMRLFKTVLLAGTVATLAGCAAHAGEAATAAAEQDTAALDLIRASFDRAELATKPTEEDVTVPAASTASEHEALIRDSFLRAGMAVNGDVNNRE